MIKVRFNETKESVLKDNRSNASKSAVYNLSSIPTIGLTLSIVAFILFDSDVLTKVYYWVRKHIHRVSNKVMEIKPKVRHKNK